MFFFFFFLPVQMTVMMAKKSVVTAMHTTWLHLLPRRLHMYSPTKTEGSSVREAKAKLTNCRGRDFYHIHF